MQAREIGTLFYRSRQEFDSRFSWSPSGDCHITNNDTWEVESYLKYAGAKFVRKYDPNSVSALSRNFRSPAHLQVADGTHQSSRQLLHQPFHSAPPPSTIVLPLQHFFVQYLLLSKCMDLQDLGDGFDGRTTYAEGASRITADTLLIGVQQDALIPPSELSMLADTIVSAGGSTEFMLMDSIYGHDAFLKEVEWLGPRVRAHLEKGLEQVLEEERVINTGINAP